MQQSELQSQLLNLGNSELQREAALAFRQFDTLEDASIAALARGLSDKDRGVRDACSMTLTSLHSQGVEIATHVAKQIITDDIEVRNLAGDVLIKLGTSSAAILWDYARHDDFDVRKFAVDIIGLIGTEADLLILIACLQDPDANVRVSAAEALGNIRSDIAVPSLLEAYQSDEEIKVPIIDALGKIGGENAENFLLERLNSEDDMYIQTACIDSLALCGSKIEISHRLAEILPSAPEELQGIILKTMCAIAYRLEQQIVLHNDLRYIAYNAINDEDPDIQSAGVIALGNNYSIEDIPSLITELERNNEATQQHILYGLLTHTSSTIIGTIINALIEKNTDNNEALISIFGILRELWNYADEEHAESILENLQRNFMYSHSHVNKFIFDFLLTINRVIASQCVAELLNSDSSSEQIRALDIIASAGLLELRDNVEFMTDSQGEVGERAKQVLQELR
ncbi:MAG TPA: HEAT repeat domain-containing protein [Candidatus Kapabacteria bacterium]|nr:HEAT repeat domain-containing protein [Candidatus Kapabacteria bacterium]